MQCPVCRSDIPDQNIFCSKCGTKIPRCPSCGQAILKRMRFCTNDGTPLPEEIFAALPPESSTPPVSRADVNLSFEMPRDFSYTDNQPMPGSNPDRYWSYQAAEQAQTLAATQSVYEAPKAKLPSADEGSAKTQLLNEGEGSAKTQLLNEGEGSAETQLLNENTDMSQTDDLSGGPLPWGFEEEGAPAPAPSPSFGTYYDKTPGYEEAPAPNPQPAAPSYNQPPKNRFCLECGKPVYDGQQLCPECRQQYYSGPQFDAGYGYDNYEDNEPTPPKKSRKGLIIAIIIIAAVILILAGIFAFLFFTDRISFKSDDTVIEESEDSEGGLIDRSASDDETQGETAEAETETEEETTTEAETEEETTTEAETEEETDISELTGDAAVEMFILTCDSVVYSIDDFEGWDADMCRKARNGIYARHGRLFDDETLQEYFNSFSWYEGTIDPDDFDTSVLTSTELDNLYTLIEYETEMGYR